MRLIDAVNMILPKLGEHAVTSLDVRHPTIAVILPEVENELRKLLACGWWFNEFNYTVYPDSEGGAVLGTDCIAFTAKCAGEAVQRGMRLYNPITLSYTFSAPIEGRVRQYVDFEEIPEHAAQFVFYSALVNAYTSDIGLTQELQVWQTHAAKAYSDLVAENLRQRKYNTKSSPKFAKLRRAMRG